MKRYVAWARVSSREQEREGFSLDVQEEALQRYAERQQGQIVQFYRVAETASKREQRASFKSLLAYAVEHAAEIDGVLFYKVDRAARNIFDYVELERLEFDRGVPVIYVAQPTENTPAGRMQRRILSNMASFYTEQQSVDVREGMARRAQSGLFVCKAPYGYRNIRLEGRGLVEIDEEQGGKVRRIFELYAHHGHTLDSLVEKLRADGVENTCSQPGFVRSKIHKILRDRCYLGEVSYRGRWYPGRHTPLVDRATFDKVQALLGQKTYLSHDSTYGAGMVRCGHCGGPVVVEIKTKQTSTGPREHRYYRCARYSKGDHPRVRMRESELDGQMLALFGKMRIEDESVRGWIVDVLRARGQDVQQQASQESATIAKELAQVRQQAERLLTLRLMDEITPETFRSKSEELRAKESSLALRLEGQGRQQAERIDVAVKVFELSQSLGEKWVTSDTLEKRQLLEIICLNLTLDGVTLVPEMRKPFDMVAEGLLVSSSRPKWI